MTEARRAGRPRYRQTNYERFVAVIMSRKGYFWNEVFEDDAMFEWGFQWGDTELGPRERRNMGTLPFDPIFCMNRVEQLVRFTDVEAWLLNELVVGRVSLTPWLSIEHDLSRAETVYTFRVMWGAAEFRLPDVATEVQIAFTRLSREMCDDDAGRLMEFRKNMVRTIIGAHALAAPWTGASWGAKLYEEMTPWIVNLEGLPETRAGLIGKEHWRDDRPDDTSYWPEEVPVVRLNNPIDVGCFGINTVRVTPPESEPTTNRIGVSRSRRLIRREM